MMPEVPAPIITVCLAVISAISYIAYKHPDGYGRLIWLLRPLTVGSFLSLAFWDIGIVQAANDLVGLIDPTKRPEAVTLIAGLRHHTPAGLIALGGLTVYFEFLNILPLLLAEKSPNKGG